MFAGIGISDFVTDAAVLGAVVAVPLAIYGSVKMFPKFLGWGKRLLAGK